jgi:PEGA domain-containing protein
MTARNFKKLAVSLMICAVSAPVWAQSTDTVLPEGTKIRVRLEQELSSATAEQGQPVELSVAEDVKVGDVVVIKQGAAVVGTITETVPKRHMGRTGKLDFSIDRVVSIEGSSIPLRYSPIRKEGGSHGLATGLLTAGAWVAFWPAAPFVLLMHGKDVTVHRGIEVNVFTDQTFAMKNAAPAPTPAVLSAAAALPVAVQVTSQPAGAEITVEGAFVGSTPATLQMSPGVHRISMKSGKSSWERDMQVQSGNIVPVNAVLTR